MSDNIVINDTVTQDTIIINDNSFVLSVNGKTGIIQIGPSDIGLGQVNNTSDLDKPISSAALSALLLKTDLALYYTLNDTVTSNYGSWNGTTFTVNSLSGNWNSVYSLVLSNSAVWGQSYTWISSNSANATFSTISAASLSGTFYGDGSHLIGASLPGQLNINTTVNSNSANWNIAYTTVQNISSDVDYNGSDVKALTGVWQSASTVVQNSSATIWNYQGTDLRGLSANWQNSTTVVQSNSANWNTAYSLVSGGIVSTISLPQSAVWQSVSNIVSSLSSNWNSVYASYNLISGTFVTNPSFQSTSALLTPITLTNILTSQLVLNSNLSNYQTSVAASTATLLPTSVYQNTSGAYVQNSSISSLSGNWNSVYSTVQSNSASNWNYQGTDVKSLTGKWEGASTVVNNTSANWNSVYTSYNTTSASFASTTLLQNTSALLTPLTLTSTLTSQLVPTTAISSLTGNWNTAYQNASAVPFTLVAATSSISPVLGSNVSSGCYSSIAGGQLNTASGLYAVVVGGKTNTSAGVAATVAGGSSNQACSQYSNIAGGLFNFICSNNSCGNNISGGTRNTASGAYSGIMNGGCNKVTGQYSTLVGGFSGCATGYSTFVGAGSGNCATGDYAVVVGGKCNTASGGYAAVSGGCKNRAIGTTSTISGGYGNTACVSGGMSFIGGGRNNTASGGYSTLGGGRDNCVASMSFVGGGRFNTASAYYTSIVGGYNNKICFTCFNNPNLSFIGGGINNTSLGYSSSIVAGNCNYIGGVVYGNIDGGYGNYNPLRSSSILGGEANHTGGYAPLALATTALSGAGSTCTQFCLPAAACCGCFTTSAGCQVSLYFSTPTIPLSAGCFVVGTICSFSANCQCVTIGGQTDLSTCTPTSLSATCVFVYDRTINNTGYDSVIGGGKLNTASGCYSVVAGGFNNKVIPSTSGALASFSTIGGGCNNTASAYFATVAGGKSNSALCYGSVGGGFGNTASGYGSVVAGGQSNCATGRYSAVAGGIVNASCGVSSFIGGGQGNCICSNVAFSFIGAGYTNILNGVGNAMNAIVAGRCNCTTSSATYSFLGGGCFNTISCINSVIVGGIGHHNPLRSSSILGGEANHTGGYAPFNITSVASISGNGTNTALIGTGIGSCFSTSGTTGAVSLYYATATNPLSSGSFCVTNVVTNAANCIIINGDYSSCTASGLSATNVFVYDRCLNIGGYDAVIGGGKLNTASGSYSTIAGGFRNTTIADNATIGGGICNTICSGNLVSVIAGGNGNIISGSGNNNTIGGGRGNGNGASYGTISGGYRNCIIGSVCGSGMQVIGGGRSNCVSTSSALYNTILGGQANCVTQNYSNIVGGLCNVATCHHANIAGGLCNTASSVYSFIASGSANDTKGFANTFILGTSLSASAANFTYVNNLSSQGIVYGYPVYSNGNKTVTKAVTSIGNGSLSSFNFVHNLGSYDVMSQVYDNNTFTVVYPTIINTSVSAINISFGFVPSLTAYRVVVTG